MLELLLKISDRYRGYLFSYYFGRIFDEMMCKSDLMIQSYVEEIRFSIKMENFLIYTLLISFV